MRTFGPENLKWWLADNGVTQEQFADRVSVGQSTISSIINRQFTPSLALAYRIQQETGGAVEIADWTDPVAAGK